MAPMAAAVAATKNSEQKIRRHRDGVNVDVGFGFVIIEFCRCVLDWLEVNGRREITFLEQTARSCQSFSREFCKNLWKTTTRFRDSFGSAAVLRRF